MPVKISKVAKDLNVGTQTIIEFLSKKNITVESNPNAPLYRTNITRCCSMRFVPTRINA